MQWWFEATFGETDNVSKMEYRGRNQVKLASVIVCNNSLHNGVLSTCEFRNVLEVRENHDSQDP